MLKYLAILSWMFLIFLSHVIAQNEIIQTASTGAEAVVDWYLQVAGSQESCVSFHADGQLKGLDVSLIFQNQGSVESWPRDMFILMKLLDPQTGAILTCHQYGSYDYSVQGCPILGAWPSYWETGDTGEYTAYADFSSANLSGSYWEMCVGNGWREDTTPVIYDGNALVDYLTVTVYDPSIGPSLSPISVSPPPTTVAVPTAVPSYIPSTPSPTVSPGYINQTAPPGANAVVDWYLQVAGNQEGCVSFFADGQLKGFNVSLVFQNQGSVESWPRDMFILMKLLDSSTGAPMACYQFGGYDYSVQGCPILGAWPSYWETGDTGEYTAYADFSSAQLSGSYWDMCVGNGWREDTTPVTYDGVALVDGLTVTDSTASNEIKQTAPAGDIAIVDFILSVAGSQESCLSFYANGQLKGLNVSLVFQSRGSQESWPRDMFILMRLLDPQTGAIVACYQFGGYDYSIQGCTILGQWPSSWETSTTGEYTAYADFSSANLSGPYWDMCVGNGRREDTTPVLYDGVALVDYLTVSDDGSTKHPTQKPTPLPTAYNPTPRPTPKPTARQPTKHPSGTPVPTVIPIVIQERCNEDVVIDFDIYLAGGENTSSVFPGNGTLTTVTANIFFGGSTYNSAEWASDILFFVKDPSNRCVIMGGFDYNVPGCVFTGYWPVSWESGNAGVYQATMNVAQGNLNGEGPYTVGFMNGYIYGTNQVYYAGNMILSAIEYDCYIPPEEYIIQDSQIGTEGSVKFDLRLTGRENQCTTLMAPGTLGEVDVEVEFDANGYAGSYAGDMFLLVKYTDAYGSYYCFQYGGFDYVEPGCTLYGKWPEYWSNNSESSELPQDYQAEADFSAANLYGSEWQVCIGNGWRENQGESTYTGELRFDDLITKGIPPTAAPTMAPSGTRSTPTTRPSPCPSVSFTPTLYKPTFSPTYSNVISIESSSQQTVIVDFDTHLSGGQSACYDFPAYGNLTGINVSMYFGGASISNVEFASDMMMTIYGTTGSVQVGGFDDFFSNVTFGGYWDESWYTSSAGTYSDSVDVSGLGVFGNGMYRICITNGYYQGEYAVIYTNGRSELLGLIYNPVESIPTLNPTQYPISSPTTVATLFPTFSPSDTDPVPCPFWPQPENYSIIKAAILIYLSKNFQFFSSYPNEIFQRALVRYHDLLNIPYNSTGTYPGCTVTISSPSSENTKESFINGVDESYYINLSTESCSIDAITIWGAMRALETFTQLLERDPGSKVPYLKYSSAVISDNPRFTHRGLMIDTSRHYIPIREIYRIIDLLPMSKFNVLHIHLVDAQSFPFNSMSSPDIAKGAFTKSLVYSVKDIQAITNYGIDRAVRVIFEIDTPGHAASWKAGYPHIMADCPGYDLNDLALNPIVDDTYTVLQGILTDIAVYTGSKYLHLGGNQVAYGCWGNDQSIVSYMEENGITSYDDLLELFVKQAQKMTISLGATPMHWEEVFTSGADVTSNSIFQVWTDSTVVKTIVDSGYQVIASPYDQWYLDNTANSWEVMYTYDPSEGISQSYVNAFLLGGEAVMFGEHIDENNIESVVFPRAAAVGERLWSPSSVKDTADALSRLDHHRCRMVERGFRVGPLQPGFCEATYV